MDEEVVLAEENKQASQSPAPTLGGTMMRTLCLHLSSPPDPIFLNMSTAEALLIILVTRTVDQDGKACRPHWLILSARLQGGMLNSLQVLQKPRTMGKLITNHAYLFIKQGLGEIQRGSAVFTSFNLQSVIKQNTAAGLGCLLSSRLFSGSGRPFP